MTKRIIPVGVTDRSRFLAAITLIDSENAKDPRALSSEKGGGAYELVYAGWLVTWVEKLKPDLSEALILAAHAQHLRRWTVSRDEYPEGLNGYLEWRERLKNIHADGAAEILERVEYDEEIIDRVRKLITKADFPGDPESRVLEDALCLVFLERQLDEFAESHPREKTVDILQKTWGKMTEDARSHALQLDVGKDARSLIDEAVGG